MNFNLENLTRVFAKKGAVLLLESQSVEHSWSHKSYLAALPSAAIQARDGEICINRNGREERSSGNPWHVLQQFRKEQNGWLFGYLGYDLKNHIEDLKSENTDKIAAPDLYFFKPQFLLEYNHKTGRGNVLIGTLPEETKTEYIESSWFELRDLHNQISKTGYLGQISEAQRRIFEGDFYEINLSHQMKAGFSGSPLKLYQRMKEIGPVPFGAYMQDQDFTVCCQSPERFLRKEGSTVFSQPIKGTSQRGRNDREDASFKERLTSSQKEKAENLMIVDLVRNDLSRIARRGSVSVPSLFDIESFETVHQMVSTVTAEAEEEDPIEIIKACFPMGSMTGAPKISVMNVIEELEDYRRGIYSGAIGYITPQGDFDFNVVIRTAIIRGEELFYPVGGAITSDSDPEAEWHETQIKARALAEVVASKESV